jgi:hypothetical protein
MSVRTPSVGDLVLSGGHLTKIYRVEKKRWGLQAYFPGRSDMGGWSQYLAHATVSCITYAEIGATVCEAPWGTHFCGLTHLPADELADLRAAEKRAADAGAAVPA